LVYLLIFAKELSLSEMNQLKPWLLNLTVFLVFSCSTRPGIDSLQINQKPALNPDYSELTIPYNIAPLNFLIGEKGDNYFVEITGKNGKTLSVFSKDGKIHFPVGKWKKLLSENKNGTITCQTYVKKAGKWNKYSTFENHISNASINKYLYYRMLYPGYESWSEISIIGRSLEDFSEKTVVNNNVIGQNCVNCHAFNRNNTADFMIHIRGTLGGTYFLKDGKLQKHNLKAKEMVNNVVYPRWHPSGKYVAFSANKVIQQFHSLDEKRIEVSDLNSSLMLYDVEKNEIMEILPGVKNSTMDTYPEWSPDGKALFFCRADSIPGKWDYRAIKYNLYKVSFEAGNHKFGQPELIYNAAFKRKSVSFPRVSPDGDKLVFTLHNYGCFPIWHREADLYCFNLKDSTVSEMKLNSEYSDSYHSWSSEGKWMVFSSKRGDGLNTRIYISLVDEKGQASKPFVLPQKDPELYNRLIRSFNVPELSDADISFTPGELKKATSAEAINVKWSKR
jgi:hypothetical protein